MCVCVCVCVCVWEGVVRVRSVHSVGPLGVMCVVMMVFPEAVLRPLIQVGVCVWGGG